MRKITFSIIGLLLLGALAGGILWWKEYSSTASNASAAAAFGSASQNASSSSALGVPDGSVAYQNAHYGFSLAYPKNLSVSERSEAAGSYTVSFEDEHSNQGFQIFVLPYADSQISLSRIQEDTHNTAAGTPQEVVLQNGAHALVFESSDPVLGPLREVWFLHGGYLFEATGYAGEDEWLAGILSTLRFN